MQRTNICMKISQYSKQYLIKKVIILFTLPISMLIKIVVIVCHQWGMDRLMTRHLTRISTYHFGLPLIPLFRILHKGLVPTAFICFIESYQFYWFPFLPNNFLSTLLAQFDFRPAYPQSIFNRILIHFSCRIAVSRFKLLFPSITKYVLIRTLSTLVVL